MYDVVLVDVNTNVLENKFERWREVLEKIELKLSRVKIEFNEFKFKNKVGGSESGYNLTFRGQIINKVKKNQIFGVICVREWGNCGACSQIRYGWMKW